MLLVQLLLMTDVPPGLELGTLHIQNDTTGTREIGNYNVRLVKHGEAPMEARVEDYPRDDGAWALVQKALEALDGL